MKKALFVLIVLLICNSCSYYKIKKVKKGVYINTTNLISQRYPYHFSLDDNNNYEVYLRKNNYEESKEGYFEMQYLIIKGEEVIYISTTPKHYNKSDRENFFDKNMNPKKFLDYWNNANKKCRGNKNCDAILSQELKNQIGYINSYYFNKFYFGKIKSNTIEFQNKKYNTKWAFVKNDDEISFNEIYKNKCRNYKNHKVGNHDSCKLHYEMSIIPERSSSILFQFVKLKEFKGFVHNDGSFKKNDFPQKVSSIIVYDNEKSIDSLIVHYKLDNKDEKIEKYKKGRVIYYSIK